MLRAARDAGVKRVVLTSSFAAMVTATGRRISPLPRRTGQPEGRCGATVKSKTLAERAA
ncbi:MAG: hypothetical protein U0694_07665 [Anaerolineae bacterium]